MKSVLSQDCQNARPYRLHNQIQHYPWGGKNERAYIAYLTGITPDQDQPYAELWMGAHSRAPSQVLDPENGSQDLSSWILEDPVNHLGEIQSKKHGPQLPYLFKVLSADRSLSIQAHPNKEQARQLYQHMPKHYPDNNHKPEIAIALDYLDALVGFISEAEYREVLAGTPELGKLVSQNGHWKANLPKDVQMLLNLAHETSTSIPKCIGDITQRLKQKSVTNEQEELFLREYRRYGSSDVGLLFLFLLRRVRLGPGEALFLPPGLPHAYLKGNIIECMANSDNVVRLGLTDKFCDAEALSHILDFSDNISLVETRTDGYLTEYLTPVSEFRVKSLSLLQGESRAFSYHTSLSMFLVIEGEIALKWGNNDQICSCLYRRGDVFIAPANLMEFSIHSKLHSKLFFVDIPD